jgi:hypothetical protein
MELRSSVTNWERDRLIPTNMESIMMTKFKSWIIHFLSVEATQQQHSDGGNALQISALASIVLTQTR